MTFQELQGQQDDAMYSNVATSPSKNKSESKAAKYSKRRMLSN